jgi:hypothetical protein
MRSVIIEMDVKIVVSDLARRHKDDTKFGFILQDYINIINEVNNFSFCYIHKMINEVAHQLARNS